MLSDTTADVGPGASFPEEMVTKTGKVITEDDIAAWVGEAEAGYDISDIPKHVHDSSCVRGEGGTTQWYGCEWA